MRYLFSLLFFFAMVNTAQAADPLRLDDSFRVLELTPYMATSEKGGQTFAIQNSGSSTLNLVLVRPPLNDLAVALGVQGGSRQALRLFSSDDREFATLTGASNGLVFTVPPSVVQSFYLLNHPDKTALYLWSPDELAAHISGRQTFHAGVLFLLTILFALSLMMTIYQRSRRGAYALTMGGSLFVLLGCLWMRDVLPDPQDFAGLLMYRTQAIQLAFGLGVLMSIVAHLNLVIRFAINRNYWTRVIIIADIGFLALASLWTLQVVSPDFAGLISSEMGDITLAMICGTIFLGAFFIPDRRY